MSNFAEIATLTADPELRFTPSGRAVVQMRLAINSGYRTSEGEWVDNEATFLDGQLWNGAENAAESLHKGTRVLVIADVRTRSWERDDGSGVQDLPRGQGHRPGPNLRHRQGREGPSGAADQRMTRSPDPASASGGGGIPRSRSGARSPASLTLTTSIAARRLLDRDWAVTGPLSANGASNRRRAGLRYERPALIVTGRAAREPKRRAVGQDHDARLLRRIDRHLPSQPPPRAMPGVRANGRRHDGLARGVRVGPPHVLRRLLRRPLLEAAGHGVGVHGWRVHLSN